MFVDGRKDAVATSGVRREFTLYLFTINAFFWCREGESNPHEVALGGF
jgi:hypothetical protein